MKVYQRHSIRLLCLFLCLFTGLFLPLAPVWSEPCGKTVKHAKEQVKYRWIYDGDTVQLSDGRKLRLIGIDTPELGKKGKKSQPFSRQAKQKLSRLLSTTKYLWLAYDQERIDKYGRVLAYAFLPDGSDIQAEMIRAGMAISIVIGKNDSNLSCYRKLEHTARAKNLGIWSLKRFNLRQAERQKKLFKGYGFIQGKVRQINDSGKYWTLRLANSIEILLSKNISERLKFYPADTLMRTIRVRGKFRKFKKNSRVKIFHPADIILI